MRTVVCTILKRATKRLCKETIFTTTARPQRLWNLWSQAPFRAWQMKPGTSLHTNRSKEMMSVRNTTSSTTTVSCSWRMNMPLLWGRAKATMLIKVTETTTIVISTRTCGKAKILALPRLDTRTNKTQPQYDRLSSKLTDTITSRISTTSLRRTRSLHTTARATRTGLK
jgi:hypothetical protein